MNGITKISDWCETKCEITNSSQFSGDQKKHYLPPLDNFAKKLYKFEQVINIDFNLKIL